ncbi:asparagine synthase-related protein [Streptomyces racemochromogenes]|uniref:asparagine synthase-related protein n=1 Tax=Streptomyces racemochromogenes TaxID=67353 RepID=UPI00376FE6AB
MGSRAAARGRHGDLLGIQDTGRMIRQLHQVVAASDFTPVSPFLDDQVVQACLAVRPEQRATPWKFKPLVKAAMADVMPRGTGTDRPRTATGTVPSPVLPPGPRRSHARGHRLRPTDSGRPAHCRRQLNDHGPYGRHRVRNGAVGRNPPSGSPADRRPRSRPF